MPMEYPRTIVFSNNCFSKTDSNGRTMGNFFLGWPKEKLAQFYIQNAMPDFSYCENFFRVTDSQALKAILGKKCGGKIANTEKEAAAKSAQKRTGAGGRNALTMLLREIVWSLGFWKTKTYKDWVREFSPEVVLLQAGDCGFMFDLALKTAKQYGAKLVIYNTEGYYFKKFDYFKGKGLTHILYPVFRWNLKRAIQKAYKKADHCIFNCDALLDDFKKEFDIEADVIYTASDLQLERKAVLQNNGFLVSYAGNLGVGRGESLIEVAQVLRTISKDATLNVYGSLPNDELKQKFEECEGLQFCGRVSYDRVKEILQESDLLLHIESFEPYYIEDLKYAFSTKIADYLASNNSFLIYAPEEFAETKYLLENEAAYVATSPQMLEKQLRQLIMQPESRKKFCQKAAALAEANHNVKTAVKRFQSSMCKLVEAKHS